MRRLVILAGAAAALALPAPAAAAPDHRDAYRAPAGAYAMPLRHTGDARARAPKWPGPVNVNAVAALQVGITAGLEEVDAFEFHGCVRRGRARWECRAWLTLGLEDDDPTVTRCRMPITVRRVRDEYRARAIGWWADYCAVLTVEQWRDVYR